MNASSPLFELFWLRESGCDAGTPLTAAELPAAIRDRVVALTRDRVIAPPPSFGLRLPYFDKFDERRSDEALTKIEFERAGNLIRCVLPATEATKDAAATCALADPVWKAVPAERDPEYFPAWQRVSMTLQRFIRDQVAEAYFADLDRLEDRAEAYEMIVYQAARPFFGKPRSEFTYDLRDYPWCEKTLELTWKLTGRHIQRVMKPLEERLRLAGKGSLARRYSPVWHQDVLVAVQKKPKSYVDLLARESAVINAVIDLGTQPKPQTVDRSAKIINRQLRKMHGLDMRSLGSAVLERATLALSQRGQSGFADASDFWTDEDASVRAAGSPDRGVRT